MSLQMSIIAIRGNCLDDVGKVLEKYDYRLIGSPTCEDKIDDAWNDLGNEPEERTEVKKLAYFGGGWPSSFSVTPKCLYSLGVCEFPKTSVVSMQLGACRSLVPIHAGEDGRIRTI
jgi:hypothetical protein